MNSFDGNMPSSSQDNFQSKNRTKKWYRPHKGKYGKDIGARIAAANPHLPNPYLALAPDSTVLPSRKNKALKNFCRINAIYKFDRKQFMRTVDLGIDPEVAMKQLLDRRARLVEIESTKNITRKNIDIIGYCRRHQMRGGDKKYFKKLLDEGLEPEAAKKKVFERKVESLKHQSDSDDDDEDDDDEDDEKDDKKDNKKGNKKEKLATGERPSGSNSIKPRNSNAIRVAALAKAYPLRKLTAIELGMLEKAVKGELARGREAGLQFESIELGKGMLLIDCKNSKTVEWLFDVVPKLNAWDGVELEACLEDHLPLPHSITVFLPNSAKQDHKTTMALIEAKNEGLNTDSWQILNSRDEGSEQVLTFGIDAATATFICAHQNMLRYGFGTVIVMRNA